MTNLVPIILSALSLAQPEAGQDGAPSLSLNTEGDVAMVAFADSLPTSTAQVAVFDIVGNGCTSRRVLISLDSEEKAVDVLDGGSWGEGGFLDTYYYITDRRGDTMTAMFTVADAAPAVSPAPEGGELIEFTDRITLSLLNHDLAETTRYILRDNQVTYHLDSQGMFTLVSIRPKPNDLDVVGSSLLIYDMRIGDEKDVTAGGQESTPDKPLDKNAFSKSLMHLFPLPGK